MDIPDTISFFDCPVRFDSTKTILVRNIGDAPAKFVMETMSPFKIIPDCGYVEVNQTIQLEIYFQPQVYQVAISTLNVL